ncbi:MAG: antibiotic biosynthesis monooxygenase [Acidobacteriia bacterium]|nr:antibiotic biosynthesis monooxygenase [Terriglobia bacterium]
MLVLIVNLQVKPEFVDAFREITTENGRNSVQEPGIVRFDLLENNEDPTRFVLYEVYRDADAPVKHRETAHYNTWVQKVTEMLVEPRTRVFYRNVFPTDQNW